MAVTERAREDQFEYTYGARMSREFVPAYPGWEQEDGRVRRTRERPKPEPQTEKKQQSLTASELRQLIFVAVFVAVLLIGILVLNAYAANIQCSINSLTKANMSLEDEIDVLNMKIDQSTSIEQVESYAMKNLNMRYPKSSQCIYIEENARLADNFSQLIRQKAYAQ